MTTPSDSSRFRRLGRALQVFLEHREAPEVERAELLERNAEIRDLLEPMLRGHQAEDVPAATAARGPFLGGFRLLREIGRGGMGIVYEAEEFALGRRVALKVLPDQPSLSARHIERFRREAAAAARLKHQGIVPVYSVGEVDGTHYFAMEYVDGESLGQALARVTAASSGDAERLDRTRLGLLPGAASHEAEVVEIVAQAAEAVAAAHAGGVLHRDIKPHNILVDRDGRVRVVDFGLAKDLERGSVTKSGEVAGTPYHMSPEQALGGRGVDARTDVFALGVVLYELLALRVPFPGESPHHVLHAILTREPESPRRANPRVSRDLETICLKAIEGDARYRYRGAGELAAELRCLQRLEPIAARPPGSVTRLVKLVRRRKAAAVAFALAFLVVVVGPTAFAIYQQSVRATLEAQEKATANERDKARTNFARARRLLEQQLERVQQLGREPGMETIHQQMADDTLSFYREFLGQPHAGADDAELELQALETHVLVARIHLTVGDHARASQVLDEALLHLQRHGDDGDVRWTTAHTNALRFRAAARRMAGDLVRARADLLAAMERQERAVASFGDAARAMLAQVLLDLASAALEDGVGMDDAAKTLARALDLATTPGSEPSAQDLRLQVAIMRKQTELLRRTGMHAEAESTCAEARRLARAAWTADPDQPEARSTLATLSMEHGTVLLELASYADAEASLREAIELRQRLAHDFPRTQAHRYGLEVSLYNLALLLMRQQRHDEARQQLDRATATIDELLAESPDSTTFADQACQAANLACLIESTVRPDDSETMEAAFRQATARHEQMLAKHPTVLRFGSGLGAVRHNHALWLMRHHEWQRARGLLEQAITAQEAAHAADPQVIQYRSFLYNHWQLLSQVLIELNDPAAAATAIATAAALRPDRGEVQLALARRMMRCADLARAADAGAASGYEDKALAMVQKAVACDPTQAAGLAADDAFAPLRARPAFAALTAGNHARD